VSGRVGPSLGLRGLRSVATGPKAEHAPTAMDWDTLGNYGWGSVETDFMTMSTCSPEVSLPACNCSICCLAEKYKNYIIVQGSSEIKMDMHARNVEQIDVHFPMYASGIHHQYLFLQISFNLPTFATTFYKQTCSHKTNSNRGGYVDDEGESRRE